MADSNIELSPQEEMENVGRALRRVTSAVVSGSPGVAPTIKGRRRTSQVTFRMRSANDRRSLQSKARRTLLGQVFSQRAAEVEIHIKKALEAVIAGLVGVSNGSVRVFGKSIGNAKPNRDIEQEPFAKFIKSKAGAGEIGLPDPNESLRNLKAALLQSITVDVIVRKDGPRVKFTFDQKRLLKLTPHPHRFESGTKGPFFSWLSLVTGPDFVTGGTPGYSLVRASDIRASLRRPASNTATKINVRRANIAEGLIRSSRTRGNAGEFAAIMMRYLQSSGRSSADIEVDSPEIMLQALDTRVSGTIGGLGHVWI